MSLDKQTSLQAMRTFARDVEREKGNSPEAAKILEKLPKTENEKVDTPKARKITAATANKQQPPIVPAVKKKGPKSGSNTKFNMAGSEEETKPAAIPSNEPGQMPAFHELQKKSVKTEVTDESAATTDKNKPKKNSTTKSVGGGTVITDNKNNRRPFFAELKKSIDNWVLGLKNSLKPKKNTYSVTQTARRKGVVQKATSKTGTIFTADNETLREQIKARHRAEKHDHDDLSWSPYTEPGYPLLEGEAVESQDPRIGAVAITPKTNTEPKPVIKTTEKIPELQTETKSAEPTVSPTVEPESPTPEALDKLESVAPTPTTEPAAKTRQVPVKEDDTVTNETPIKLRNFELEDTNTLAMLIMGILLGIGVIGFVLFNILSAPSEPVEPEVSATESTTALYPEAALVDISIGTWTFNEIVKSLNSAMLEQSGNQIAEYRFVNQRNFPVPGSTLTTIIRTDDTDGFANSVTELRFIQTDNGNRGVLFQLDDAATALGGMLNWEDTLYADLGTLLDTADLAPPSAGAFVDEQFGTLDVRRLEFGEATLLIYSFINETDVIVATDSNVLRPYAE